MTLQLYAQPYDISAHGFYFGDGESFQEKASKLRNAYGQPVEEFELQFIDGEGLDCAFAEAFGLNQANYAAFFEYAETWEDWGKMAFIIAVGECGYSFDFETVCPTDFDVEISEVETMRELAEQFVDDGLFGDIPESLQNYIDYDAIARDLAIDYSETQIGGTNIIYRCS